MLSQFTLLYDLWKLTNWLKRQQNPLYVASICIFVEEHGCEVGREKQMTFCLGWQRKHTLHVAHFLTMRMGQIWKRSGWEQALTEPRAVFLWGFLLLWALETCHDPTLSESLGNVTSGKHGAWRSPLEAAALLNQKRAEGFQRQVTFMLWSRVSISTSKAGKQLHCYSDARTLPNLFKHINLLTALKPLGKLPGTYVHILTLVWVCVHTSECIHPKPLLLKQRGSNYPFSFLLKTFWDLESSTACDPPSPLLPPC